MKGEKILKHISQGAREGTAGQLKQPSFEMLNKPFNVFYVNYWIVIHVLSSIYIIHPSIRTFWSYFSAVFLEKPLQRWGYCKWTSSMTSGESSAFYFPPRLHIHFLPFFLQEPSLNVPFELAVQLIAWKDQPPAERKRKRASNCTKTKQQINDNRTHTHNSGSLNMADSWKWTNQGIDQSCVTGPQRGGRSHFE